MNRRFPAALALLLLLGTAGVAFASDEKVDPAELVKADWSNNLWLVWLIAPAGAAAALVFAYIFFLQMKAENEGNETMKRIAKSVREGAFAYLRQQMKVVAIVFVVLSVILTIMWQFGLCHWLTPFAFLTGGFFSGLCGLLGMNSATLASNRTAQAASENLNRGLQVAFRSGAVMGLVVVGLALVDISAWFWVLTTLVPDLPLGQIVVVMLSFGMGASTQALFARVGGGIYTKAADVGSDLVGKTELNIPEDDPRNPATIADNVGDNVGDVAGMGADLYESYAGAILATAALGFATARSIAPECTASEALPWVMLPMLIAGGGNILSILGIYAVRSGEDISLKSLMAALFRGINVATVGVIFVAIAASWFCFKDSTIANLDEAKAIFGITYWIGIAAAVAVGLIAGWIIGKATEYYTSNDYAPTQELARQAPMGYGPVIIDGVAVGMFATAIPVVTVAFATLLAFALTDGFDSPMRGLYGVSLAAVGMLSTLGITLATDAYGPIADNAGGNAQMARLDPKVRERTDALDALGNTTAATGKGFAIGSAALTALALLAAYVEEIRGVRMHVMDKEHPYLEWTEVVRSEVTGADGKKKLHEETVKRSIPLKSATLEEFMTAYEVHLMNPKVIVGTLIGAMMVFLFCAMTMKAVGRAAGDMVNEVRRQWREIPGLAEGKAEPDHARCVQIATRGAQRKMIVPSMTAIIVPIVVGLLLDVAGVMGLLAGTVAAGFAMAIMMAAAGGAWDNAKKWIEGGNLKEGGKGSAAHHAAVVGDTVGDPFKDTSGPSLNILIKLMSMVSIVFVGLTVSVGSRITEWLSR